MINHQNCQQDAGRTLWNVMPASCWHIPRYTWLGPKSRHYRQTH